MNQIERDLRRHAQERLQKWVYDTRNVFNMAELDDSTAAACIMSELTVALVSMMKMTGFTADEFEKMLDDLKRHEARQRYAREQ